MRTHCTSRRNPVGISRKCLLSYLSQCGAVQRQGDCWALWAEATHKLAICSFDLVAHSVVCGPAVLASPRSMLKIINLGLHPRPIESLSAS